MADETTPAPTSLTQDEKTMAMLSHLLVLTGYVIPFATILAPLIIYLMKKDQSKFVAFHALQSLIFQCAVLAACFALSIPLFILFFVTAGLAILLIWPLAILVGLGLLIYVILTGIKANNGELVKYPIVGDFVYKKVYGPQ